ncbi:hypothetical protein O3P69_015461 [Scylla paramamosain]|uniref:Uncharacterized protein n=1 Tax=Scylla paramamosain TaxID=85552 RepID=A0AAW0T5I6_SCYPA
MTRLTAAARCRLPQQRVASAGRQVGWSKPSERLNNIFEAAQEARHESSTQLHMQGRKVSPSRARQSRGTSNVSQHESLDCRNHRLLPGARVRRSTIPQRTHKAHGHHNHHHHTHSHQDQRERQGSGRRLRKRHQSRQQQQQQRPSRLQLSQPEYRVTLREDVPIHTSLLTTFIIEVALKHW